MVNFRLCPFCLLEKSNKPMTPSNQFGAQNRILVGVIPTSDHDSQVVKTQKGSIAD